jgi:hypothetical protein
VLAHADSNTRAKSDGLRARDEATKNRTRPAQSCRDQILVRLHQRTGSGPYLFPYGDGGRRVGIRRPWMQVCKAQDSQKPIRSQANGACALSGSRASDFTTCGTRLHHIWFRQGNRCITSEKCSATGMHPPRSDTRISMIERSDTRRTYSGTRSTASSVPAQRRKSTGNSRPRFGRHHYSRADLGPD